MTQKIVQQTMTHWRKRSKGFLLFIVALVFVLTAQPSPAQLMPLEGSAHDLKPLPSTSPPPNTPSPDTSSPDLEGIPAAATSDAETFHQSRYDLLAAGDQLFLAGDIAGATALYRQAKGSTTTTKPLAPPVQDASQLPPAGQLYWREAQAGDQSQLYSAKIVPLQLLIESFPQFIPAHLKLAEHLRTKGDNREAQALLERAFTLYPDQPELARALVLAHDQRQEWLEASLTAQQFLILNPQHPQVPEFGQMAEERMQRFRRNIQGKIQEGLIASAITGVVGVAVTGSPFMSLSTVQTLMLVMQGENALGEAAARQLSRQLKLVDQPEITAYINNLGQKLARIAGRSEFNYEFFVINDSRLNAFALPGGKVFINSGAITKANSEAELAGLIGHEIAHAVLSHGFQLATQGTATINIARLLPVGQYLAGVTITSFSRDMERQADVLGTRILARSGYAADGLINFTYLLNQEYRGRNTVLPWFSTHPSTPERLRYLEGLIDQQNYNRFGFEGVYSHRQIQAQLQEVLNPSPESNPDQSNPKATAETPISPADNEETVTDSQATEQQTPGAPPNP